MPRKIPTDLPIPLHRQNMMRKDFGLQNLVGLDHMAGPKGHQRVELTAQNVMRKLQGFADRAVHPQQVTIPRQYATTREGTWVHKVLEGRVIDGVQEQGVRVIVQENAKLARFVMSPLFSSKTDALSWASQHMGAKPNGNI
jgi:hypothetical protein